MQNQGFRQLTTQSHRTHQRQIIDSQDLPVSDSERSPTDIFCTVLGVIFGVTMFVVALIAYDHKKLQKLNYASDRKGRICNLEVDENQISYPFVYFNDINDPLSSRFCVRQCPQEGVRTLCLEKSCPLIYYSNYPSVNSLGEFCLPQNENEKNKLLYKANLFERWNSQKAIDLLLWGLLISFGLSLVIAIFGLLIPKITIWLVTVLALGSLGATGIIFLLNNKTTLEKGSVWVIVAAILCALFVLVFLIYLILHRQKIIIAGSFLKTTSNYLKSNLLLFAYIPAYIGLTFLFGILTVFEYLAFSCFGEPQFSHDSVFYRLPIQGFWTFLLVVQTIWGLSFFRDSFNYIIASTAADEFFKAKGTKPGCFEYQKKCLKFNFGSVAGGSLINGFLYFPSLIVNLFFPRIDFFCCNLFDLVRTDAYSYIGLTGNSYCPSVRQTQYLCYRSNVCRQNQSTNSFYCLAARIFVALGSILIVYFIAKNSLVEQKIPPLLLVGLFFIGLYISCYFVDIQLSSCEGFLTAFLIEIEMDQQGYKDMTLKNENMNILKDQIHEVQKIQGKQPVYH